MVHLSLASFVHANHPPIGGGDMVDILGAVHAAWDEGQNPASSSDPANEAAKEECQTAAPILEYSLNLWVWFVCVCVWFYS